MAPAGTGDEGASKADVKAKMDRLGASIERLAAQVVRAYCSAVKCCELNVPLGCVELDLADPSCHPPTQRCPFECVELQ